MKTYADSALKALCETLAGLGTLQRYSDYRDRELPESGSLSYESCNQQIGKDGHVVWDNLFLPVFFTYSDYSGSTVERSNCDVFMEEHKEETGIYEMYGGYGTRGIAIRLSAVTAEMIESFQALRDYPLMSEEHHSNLEWKMEQDAWDDWIERDFRRELQKKFPDLDEKIDSMPDCDVYDLFRERMEKTNTYYVHEDAVSVYVDINELLKGMTEQDLG